MGRIVIACYRPKRNRRDALRALMASHVPTLRAEGLVTDRRPILMEAADGTLIEVFEWRSKDAIDAAHANPRVLAMWERYAQVCDYVPVGAVPEASTLFSEFAPVGSDDY
jgi:quinol monooxygenase YgiN